MNPSLLAEEAGRRLHVADLVTTSIYAEYGRLGGDEIDRVVLTACVQTALGRLQACLHYEEDPAIADDVGESKEQCVCGWPKIEHLQFAEWPIETTGSKTLESIRGH